MLHAGCGCSKEPNPTGLTVIDKLSKKDWRGLWQMASAEEKADMGIDEEQFVRLNEVITEGFPAHLSCKLYEEFKPSDFERTYAVKMMALPKVAPDLAGQTPLISLQINLIEGRWTPKISSIPLQLTRFQNEDKEQRHRRLLRAMAESDTSWLLLNKRKLRIEDQRLVVEGKLEQMEAFR